ncbi:MAG TPA: ABC transporter ATP-binding protein [Candidatus Limnocylindrales bacterium]|nr:ABC transporter ATP-binding protein [Candidatus Limnocylindrales bacterium]
MSDAVPAPALALRGVAAGYGPRTVLRDVDLTIEPGEWVAVVGPNGAGKSTLLRLLTGVLRPILGEIEVDGRPVQSLSREAVARRIAVVPQPAALPFSATVEAIVALGRLPHEDPIRGLRPADRAAVAAAVDRVGLGRLVGRDVRELSLGERQLVLLAVAIAQAAPIVMLDEPTVHLDIRHQLDVIDLLADLVARDRRTVVTVLHDLQLAARVPRIVVVAGGRIAADGPPELALRGDVIREVFGVEPDRLPAGPWTASRTVPGAAPRRDG